MHCRGKASVSKKGAAMEPLFKRHIREARIREGLNRFLKQLGVMLIFLGLAACAALIVERLIAVDILTNTVILSSIGAAVLIVFIAWLLT